MSHSVTWQVDRQNITIETADETIVGSLYLNQYTLEQKGT